MKGLISHIQRYSTQDGAGIRTTVFLMGCNLRCVWCSNPELLKAKPITMYFASRCQRCGCCAAIEPNIHIDSDGCHVDREHATKLKECEEACVYDAYETVGRKVSAQELVKELQKDAAFYASSGGGVTFSGGEALLQEEFLQECATLLHEQHISVCIDTAGALPWATLEKASTYTDVFLYDVKAFDDDLHKRCTGASNQDILANLYRLGQGSVPIWIRMPIIGGINDDRKDILKRLDVLRTLPALQRLDILPYHNLGEGKYAACGYSYALDAHAFVKDELLDWIVIQAQKRLRACTIHLHPQSHSNRMQSQ